MDGNLLYFHRLKTIKENGSWALKVPGWSEFSRVHTGNVLTDVDVPILCIPIDAKYKKTETIGFTTLLKKKKALKKVVWQNGRTKVKCLYVKLVNQMLTKKQLKMGNGF
jgi:hypothetical protein